MTITSPLQAGSVTVPISDAAAPLKIVPNANTLGIKTHK
jgi:hypothetical protein